MQLGSNAVLLLLVLASTKFFKSAPYVQALTLKLVKNSRTLYLNGDYLANAAFGDV